MIFVAYELNLPLNMEKPHYRWWMEPDFGSWQSPDISRFHLYRGTIGVGCYSCLAIGPYVNPKFYRNDMLGYQDNIK